MTQGGLPIFGSKGQVKFGVHIVCASKYNIFFVSSIVSCNFYPYVCKIGIYFTDKNKFSTPALKW